MEKRAAEQAFFRGDFARLQSMLGFIPGIVHQFDSFFGTGLKFVGAYFLLLLRMINGRNRDQIKTRKYQQKSLLDKPIAIIVSRLPDYYIGRKILFERKRFM